MEIIIDNEFKELIAPLTDDEYTSLKNNLLENGFNKAYPIILWKGHNILVDGHNRYGLCQRFGIEPDVIEQEFEDRQAVINWMVDNQLSRRNVDPDTRAYLIGKKYTQEKKTQGGSRGNSCTLRTDEKIAKEFDISPRTAKTDGKFFELIERVCKLSGLSRQDLMKYVTKKDVLSFDKLNDNEIITRINNAKKGESVKTQTGVFPVLIKLDKSTNTKLKAMSKSKTPQELITELINAEYERRGC